MEVSQDTKPVSRDVGGKLRGGPSAEMDAHLAELLDRELLQAAAQESGSNSQPQPAISEALQTSKAAGENGARLKDDVIRVLANTLKLPLEKVDEEENIAVYGVDSIRVTEFIRKIAAMLEVEMLPMIFFEAKNIRTLAALIHERFPAKVAAHYAKSGSVAESAPATTVQEPPSPPPVMEEKIQRWIQKSRSTRIPGASLAASVVARPHQQRSSSGSFEPIAIIGMEGIFPGSPDLDSYWRNLVEGKDCITEIPRERWDWKKVYGDPAKGPFTRVKWGGFIGEIDKFDAFFFGISPREAELMDPQHRLFLECAWRMLETSGYPAAALSNKAVGVFLGINLQDYWSLVRTRGRLDARQLTGLGHMFCPNRLSFLLNVTGPSEVIDTACSSSLVAVNRAAAAIHCGDCEMAIVGGSNLMITPEMHLIYSRMGMVCEDGRCKTFSKNANGYVRAEGIGALLLKPLASAEREQDRILGVLRGSFENHGGTGVSLTAPNPAAQSRVIVAAHQRAGTDVRAVGYVECHGTGTALGDPIEVNGLKMAFEKLYCERDAGFPETPHCGLGSVKSNIGHTETCAGIAGVIKVLLAMQHAYLPPSLHCHDLNPLLELEGSPFYVLQQGRPWELVVLDGREQPRVACVSSFGAGGANAHVVLEQYTPPPPTKFRGAPPSATASAAPHLIVLSAKDEERLRAYASSLLVFLSEWSDAPMSLEDIAYTLQVARDALEFRVAFLVVEPKELQEKLEEFVAGRAEIEGCFQGRIKKMKRNPAATPPDPEFSTPFEPTDEDGDLSRVAQSWVNGDRIDWQKLYRAPLPRRIPLPSYPFARKRYWVPADAANPAPFDVANGVVVPRYLHPLVQENTSKFGAQEFTTRFTGEEFFLDDHRVRNEKVLPGVAYLEMARAAAVLSGRRDTLAIRNAVWTRPLKVEGEVQTVAIRLSAEQGALRYDVSTREKTHSQGQVMLGDAPTGPSERIDIIAIQQRCTAQIPASELYEGFARVGLSYGETFQGIENVWFNEREALARIQSPERAKESLEHFKLHPSVMDAALQTVAALTLRGTTARTLYVPFSVESVELNGPTPETGYAYVRLRSGAAQPADTITCDVQIVTDSGEICVFMKQFSARELQSQAPGQNTIFATTQWCELPLEQNVPSSAKTIFMLAGSDAQISVALQKDFKGEFEQLPAYSGSRSADYILELYSRTFDRVQRILQQKQAEQQRIIVIVPGGVPDYMYAPIAGLFRTARLENPNIEGKVIALAAGMAAEEAAKAIAQEAGMAAAGEQVRYLSSGQREVNTLVEMPEIAPPSASPIKSHGVYWITGGAGGLGLIFARYIMKTPGARVVLSGRSRRGDAKLGVLEQMDPRVSYLPADLASLEDTRHAMQTIMRLYGRLDGVLHSAGIIKDNFVVNKSRREIAEVFAPKVEGLLNLDECTKDLPLDFMVLFSSIAGLAGNPGQADYAGANLFLDAFARHRNQLAAVGTRTGRTLSISWPLWRNGGMRLEPAAEKFMADRTGLHPLATEDGLKAFELALKSECDHCAVASGDAELIRKKLLSRETRNHPAESAPRTAAKPAFGGELSARVERKLLQIVGRILKISERDIPLDEELNAFGFDSVTLTELVNELNQEFEINLAPTIFFEYPRLRAFRDYLMENYQQAFAVVLGVEQRYEGISQAAPDPSVETAPLPDPGPGGERVLAHSGASAEVAADYHPDAVAIVGMSGRFPMAGNLEELWTRLSNGDDCISEIPADRWDWRTVYGDPIREANRTNVKWGGFIRDVDKFDPLFFGISPEEAERMDPNQRLLMEHTWMAIEDAGHSAKSLWGSNTGVFVGTASSGYAEMLAEAKLPLEAYSSTGAVPSVGPNRISYFLNLHGPSEPVETACSSSLVAIHRGVEAIRNGTCDQAIVGGVNTILTPNGHIMFSRAGMLSQDGRCKTFSNSANGYVRSEGVGILFIKRLGRALEDGDHIYGLIRSTCVNHGGRANSLTAPNVAAQAALLELAYRQAGIDPATVTYIEAHGSGTGLGDPVEIEALKKAFRELASQFGPNAATNYCGLGSIKTNIGHAELAAGVAGVVKVLLAIRYGQLPPSLHCKQLNAYIELKDSPFYVVKELKGWERARDGLGRIIPRRAGISSFGYGGANAHVVIEEFVSREPDLKDEDEAQFVIVPLSAKSPDVLRSIAQNLHQFLEQSSPNLSDLAYTLQLGREQMNYRTAFLVRNLAELKDKLAQFIAGRDAQDSFQGQAKKEESEASMTLNNRWQGAPPQGVAQSELARLCREWVAGGEFGWGVLWKGSKRKRLSLPTYPFVRLRCWIPSLGEKLPNRTSAAHTQPSRSAGSNTFLLAPIWEPVCPEFNGVPRPGSGKAILIIAGNPGIPTAIRSLFRAEQYKCSAQDTVEALASRWRAAGPLDHIIWLAPASGTATATGDSVLRDQEEGVLLLFRTIKALLRLGYGQRSLEWTVVTFGARSISSHEPVAATHAGIHGLVGAMAKEYRGWRVRLVDLPSQGPLPRQDIASLAPDPDGDACVYRNGQWHKEVLVSVREKSSTPEKSPYRDGGVYVVIGGAGGIGELWTESIVQEHRAHVVWIGRRPLDAAIQRKISRISTLGPAPIYVSADAGDLDALMRAYREIKRTYPAIHGLIHSAIDLRDQSLNSMDEASFRTAFSAKAATSVRMAQVFSDEPLDFVVFFSSIMSFTRLPGQGNYAAGCVFQDAFAGQLRREWSASVKVLNWGYWGSKGAVASSEYRERMSRLGIGSIELSEALKALQTLLTGDLDQLALVNTTAPNALRNMKTDETVEVYSQEIPSVMDSLTLQTEAAELAEAAFQC